MYETLVQVNIVMLALVGFKTLMGWRWRWESKAKAKKRLVLLLDHEKARMPPRIYEEMKQELDKL